MSKDDGQYPYVTTQVVVDSYSAGIEVFKRLKSEVRELSKKKPDATMSKNKLALINRVLADFLVFLKGEPEGKYLSELSDEDTLQISDALLMIVQFDAALDRFAARYRTKIGRNFYWITEEFVANGGNGIVTADDRFHEDSMFK